MTNDQVKMTREQREQVRLSLLRYANAAGGNGMTFGLFLQTLRAEGQKIVSPQELLEELGYLMEKGLLAELPKLLSPENKAWRITAAGRDWCAENGME